MHGESAAKLNSKFSSSLGGKGAEVEDPEFDVTAMVDLVSLMNIYFLVAWVVAMQNEVNLPAAKKVVSGDPDTSVIVIVKTNDQRGMEVKIGEDNDGEPLTDRAEILKQVEAAVKAGSKERKNTLLLKAEKEVMMKDISYIAGAASAADGFDLRLAVFEKETK
jgi:biopolymer transport protein ExbD